MEHAKHFKYVNYNRPFSNAHRYTKYIMRNECTRVTVKHNIITCSRLLSPCACVQNIICKHNNNYHVQQKLICLILLSDEH